MPVYFKNQVAHYLRQLCQSTGSLFLDLEFPATVSSLTHETEKVADLDITWLRPSELSENPCLFAHSRPETVRQGRLGNCWFVAACACLILHETVFQKVVVIPQFRTWSSYCGLFEFRFWRFGEWIHVVVDDLLPTLNGELLYCHSCNPDEFWCALLEKAYAKYFICDVRRVTFLKFPLLGSYEALEGGELADALIDFTGGFTECLEISRSPTDSCLVAATLEVPSPISFNDGRYSGKLRSNLVTPLWKNAVACDLLYKLLSAHHLQNTLIAAAISTRNVRDQEKETVLGLLIGHAYAVTHFCAVPVVHSSELFSERRALLVRVTNPWGHGTWKGSFAVGSELLERDELNNGHIWMRFEDFLEQFNYIVVCHTPIGHSQWFLFTPGLLTESCANSQGPVLSTSEYKQSCLPFCRPREFWTTVSFHGIWSLNTSGGCLNCTHTFFSNPQFRFDVPHRSPSQIALYLIQKTARDPDRCKSTTGLYHIGMSVFRVEANRTSSISSLREHVQLIANSCYRNSRTVWMRLYGLPYGRYVVVPTTFYADCFTEFMLRFVGPPPITAFPLEHANPWSKSHFTGTYRVQATGGTSRGVLIRFDESFLFHHQSRVGSKINVGIQLFIQNPVYDELHSQCSLSFSMTSRSSLIKRIPLSHASNFSSIGAWKRNAIRVTRIRELLSFQKTSSDIPKSCDRVISPYPIQQSSESLHSRFSCAAFYHNERLLAESESYYLKQVRVPETSVFDPKGFPSLFGPGDTDSCGTITLLFEG